MKLNNSILLIIFALVSLSACQSKKDKEEVFLPAQTLYNSGVELLEAGKHQKAADEFEKVFFQHPGNPITPEAELMQAYSLYLAGEYDEVGDVLDIFLRLHPRHRDVAYAYYLKSIAHYTQISSVKLDQSRTRYAKKELEEVINRFPGSKYAIDAALKIDLVNDHLAGKEMLIGRYYLNKNNPIAALRRFQNVIKDYDTTSHIAEALYRMAEGNMMLGLDMEAKKYIDVLMHNYPEDRWSEFAKQLLK